MIPFSQDENRITYFAETDARNKRVKFGIRAKDRTRHVYVIGKTGMGKSTLLENMAVQDIQNGEGMAFIDPHGKTADLMLEYVPKERIKDVIYIAPFDVEFPISFNVLESVDPAKRHLVTSGLMSTFKKIWEDAWSARMEYILTNTLLALLEAPNTTLLGVNRMLSDKDYRKEIVSHVQDPSVKAFWNKEFANYTERQAAEAVPAIQNKVGQFTANPLIRNMIGQPVSSFDFREAMDSRKIIIINLSKGRIGDENMKLLGGLLVTKIYLAAMSRADVPDRIMKNLPNFYLFVDEFQNFANASFADILSEARKYKLNLTIAHQYIEQMDELVRPAVFGNVGTMIAFRVGATDAEAFEQEFAPVFVIEDLVNLGFAQIYMKLMIDGLSSPPFSATTLPPIAHPEASYVTEIIQSSRDQFTRPRAEVEEGIVKFHEPTAKAVTPKVVTAAPTIASVAAPTPPIAKPFAAKITDTAPTLAPKVVASAFVEKKVPVPKVAVPKSLGATRSVVEKNIAPPTSYDPKPIEREERVPSVIVPKMDTVKPQPEEAPKPPVSSISTAPLTHSVKTPLATPQAPIPQKPVSLSTLTAKPAIKADPKARSPENVNELRNALAAVLGKSKTAPVISSGTSSRTISTPVLPATQASHPAPKTEEKKPMENTAASHVQSPQAGSISKGETTPKPPEVPEDVLANILKLD